MDQPPGAGHYRCLKCSGEQSDDGPRGASRGKLTRDSATIRVVYDIAFGPADTGPKVCSDCRRVLDDDAWLAFGPEHPTGFLCTDCFASQPDVEFGPE